jgi:hypothetical protein
MKLPTCVLIMLQAGSAEKMVVGSDATTGGAPVEVTEALATLVRDDGAVAAMWTITVMGS